MTLASRLAALEKAQGSNNVEWVVDALRHVQGLLGRGSAPPPCELTEAELAVFPQAKNLLGLIESVKARTGE